ncbi:MAG TPA: hypothetical protein VFA20_17040 [Myxococcaceae bacterium]|nr:hypothetical protein [Myxococcaceae bacterium]
MSGKHWKRHPSHKPYRLARAWVDGSMHRRELQERCAEVFLAVFQELVANRSLGRLRPIHPDDKVLREERDYGLFEAMKPLERERKPPQDEAQTVKPPVRVPQSPLSPPTLVELDDARIHGFDLDLGLPLEGEGGRAPSRLISVRLHLDLTFEPDVTAKLACLDDLESPDIPLPLVLGNVLDPFQKTVRQVLDELEKAAQEPRCAIRAIQALRQKKAGEGHPDGEPMWAGITRDDLGFDPAVIALGYWNKLILREFARSLALELETTLVQANLYLASGRRTRIGDRVVDRDKAPQSQSTQSDPNFWSRKMLQSVSRPRRP